MVTLGNLSREEKRNVALLRQAFFRDILLGRRSCGDDQVALKQDDLDSSFYAAGLFRLVLLKIDGLLAFSQDYSSVDQSLIKASIIELCETTLPGAARHVTLDMGNDGIVCVLNSLDRVNDLGDESLSARIDATRSAIGEKHGLSVTFSLSPAEPGIENLPALYEKALEAALYRLYRGHGATIHWEETQVINIDPYEYPTGTEKLLVTALLEGKLDLARERYAKIVESVRGRPLPVFNMALSRLAFSVDEAARTIGRIGGDDSIPVRAIPISSLSSAETIDEITERFDLIFADICASVVERKSTRNEQIVDRINRLIETGYASQELYIESIAERLDKSPTYISHVYKQRTGITILDKIVEVRLTRAKELLASTDLSVADISERAGFSSGSYFFKVFRKQTGQTPNEFREREGRKP
jgi:AraC-like DNA-binding protein